MKKGKYWPELGFRDGLTRKGKHIFKNVEKIIKHKFILFRILKIRMLELHIHKNNLLTKRIMNTEILLPVILRNPIPKALQIL